jgi:hypothetical protein
VPSGSKHIRVSEINGVLLVCFHDLASVMRTNDVEQINQIGEELNNLVDQDVQRPIVLDFEDKEFIPWATIEGMLVQLHKKLDGNLKMCHLPLQVRNHFALNHLERVFHILSTREEAVSAAAAE